MEVTMSAIKEKETQKQLTAISDQTHHEKAISKAQSRDHNVGTNQEHFHQ